MNRPGFENGPLDPESNHRVAHIDVTPEPKFQPRRNMAQNFANTARVENLFFTVPRTFISEQVFTTIYTNNNRSHLLVKYCYRLQVKSDSE